MLDSVDPNHDGQITFEEFIQLMQEVEQKIVTSERHGQNNDLAGQSTQKGIINIHADSKVLDFLRLLEEYRRKCEEEGNNAEARKSKTKFDELLKKETIRQKNNIRAAQEQEL